MNELQVFNNPDFGEMRVVEVDGEPWFVGKDVAAALGYKDTVNALKAHVDDEDKKGGWRITTPSGEQDMTIINESGVYSLIFSSKLEGAKKFKRWVTAEVLPAIRRQGAYIAPNAQPQVLDGATVQAFTVAIDGLTSMVQALALRMDALEQRPALPAPAKPPENKARRQWMRTASQMLDKLADECGLPSTTVLYSLYQELETEFDTSLAEIRLKAIEERQLGDCSFLLAIFYDDTLREWFVGRVNALLSDKNPFW